MAAHAIFQPQKVYKFFISLDQHKLTFSARTKTNIADFLKECEISVNNELLPNLLMNPAYNQKYRTIISLAIRESGLNIPKPEERFIENERSVQLSSPFSLSLPESQLKQQKIIQKTTTERKKKKLAIKSKKTEIKSE